MESSFKNAIVVGGGIVGSVQALLLAGIGYRVKLVDAAPADRLVTLDKCAIDNALAVRTVAMSWRSKQLLESRGLWVEELGCPIHTVMVNEQGRFGSVQFDRHDYSVPALGYVVKNRELEVHLHSLLANDSGVEVIKPGTAELLSVDVGQAEVTISTAERKRVETADLLIAADGTQSNIRKQLGIEVDVTDYQQHALIANLVCQREHSNIAYERFTDAGPLAILPLDKNTVAMVCTLDSSETEKFSALTDSELLAEIQQRFGGRLGRFQQIGERGVFPLSMIKARQLVKGCGVLVGNAAQTLHPVAGQGLNLALRDVFELTAQLSKNELPGDTKICDALAAFSKARLKDRRFVATQTDVLARLFRRHRFPLSLPLGAFKTTSMLLLDSVPMLRNRFGRRNAGLEIPLNNVINARGSRI